MYYIFTDGSASKKRKSIGSAYAIYDENKNLISDKAIAFKDENARIGIAELMSVYLILNYIERQKVHDKNIIIYSDSQYVVNELNIWFKDQLLKNFYKTKNKDIIIYILYILYFLRNYNNINIQFIWVRGHQNKTNFESIGNNYVDKLAVNIHENYNSIKNDIINIEKDLENFIIKYEILKFLKKVY